MDNGLRNERSFLAMCLAAPDAGEEALARIDPEELLTGGVLRRVAGHLRGRLEQPLADLPEDDDELAAAIAELMGRAARGGAVSADQLEHARLLLELARLDRAIASARTRVGGEAGLGITDLARERQGVREALGAVVSRL